MYKSSASNGLTIISGSQPNLYDIEKSCIYLRGSLRENDNNINYKKYNSAEEAERMRKDIINGLYEWAMKCPEFNSKGNIFGLELESGEYEF